MKFIFFVCIFGLFACNEKFEYQGTFHKNHCSKGASYILIEDEKLAVGSESSKEFDEVILRMAQGKRLGFSPVSISGCEKVYSVKLNGEIVRESSLTGYGNDELRKVIQVREFSFH